MPGIPLSDAIGAVNLRADGVVRTPIRLKREHGNNSQMSIESVYSEPMIKRSVLDVSKTESSKVYIGNVKKTTSKPTELILADNSKQERRIDNPEPISVER